MRASAERTLRECPPLSTHTDANKNSSNLGVRLIGRCFTKKSIFVMFQRGACDTRLAV